MFRLHQLVWCALALPGDDFQLPDKDIDWIERNKQVLYPSIAIVVVLLMVIGILRAWRTTELNAEAKTKFKGEILRMMRMNLAGLLADEIAKAIGLDRLKTLKLLEEMQRDGVLQSHTTTQRFTVWRVRGLDRV